MKNQMPATAGGPPSSLPAGPARVTLLGMLRERWVFARKAARLCEALLVRYDALHAWSGGPTRPDLERLVRLQHDHVALLEDVIGALGAKLPTPDLSGASIEKLPAAFTHTGSTLREGLHALLAAALADHDGWEDLYDLASVVSDQTLATRLEGGLGQAAAELREVRGWIGRAVRPGTSRASVARKQGA